MNRFKVGKLNLVVIGATILTCAIFYMAYEPNAYEVYLDGNSVAYVMDFNKAESIAKDVTKDITNRFGDIKIGSDLSYEKIIVDNNVISTDESIKKNMLAAMGVRVPAVEMIIDNKSVGILANEKEGEAVINSLTNQYLAKLDLENKKLNSIKSYIRYIKMESSVSSVNSVEEVVSKISKLNENMEGPLLKLEFSGQRTEDVSIDYGTTIKWSDSINKGGSKIESKGVKGTKRQQQNVIFINEKESNVKVVKETVIEKPKNEVILKGIKDSSQSAVAMYVPSRGSISSNFGMRWGKLHEGIDIAAPIGTPIYAALDGEVIFAGWQNGYGNVIILAHENSLETVYGHCSKIEVKVNQKIGKGQVIGKVGSTGRSTGPHLHFEVKLNGKPQDPKQYIYNKQIQG